MAGEEKKSDNDKAENEEDEKLEILNEIHEVVAKINDIKLTPEEVNTDVKSEEGSSVNFEESKKDTEGICDPETEDKKESEEKQEKENENEKKEKEKVIK
jgi:hypothetical protein